MIDYNFLPYKPPNLDIVCTSDHSCRIGKYSVDPETGIVNLYIGDRIDMWPGSALKIDPPAKLKGQELKLVGDGLIIDTRNLQEKLFIGLPTCDCIPAITLANEMVGIVHISTESLFRFQSARIGTPILRPPVLKTIFNDIDPEDSIWFFGPCIHAECYEFGADDASQFIAPQVRKYYPEVNPDNFILPSPKQGKVQLDFPGLTIAILESLGVSNGSIIIKSCECTVCSVGDDGAPKWHSYRRSGTNKHHNWLTVEISP